MSKWQRHGELGRAFSCIALMGIAACTSAGVVKLSGSVRIVTTVTMPDSAEVGPEAPGAVPKQVGLNHMAWMVDTLDELKTLYQRLKDNNVPIRSIVDHGLSLTEIEDDYSAGW